MLASRATLAQDVQSNACEDRVELLEIDVKMLESDIAHKNLALQQVMNETNATNIPINPSLQLMLGLR
jgi:hypothetical protein